jgi:hypothetical protein
VRPARACKHVTCKHQIGPIASQALQRTDEVGQRLHQPELDPAAGFLLRWRCIAAPQQEHAHALQHNVYLHSGAPWLREEPQQALKGRGCFVSGSTGYRLMRSLLGCATVVIGALQAS